MLKDGKLFFEKLLLVSVVVGLGTESPKNPDKQNFEHEIVIIFLFINLNMIVFSLIETVLLSTHNICFG